MPLFRIDKCLKIIKEKPFKLERELQTLTEENITTVFNLELVKSEFSIGNFRLDTLAYDRENNAFVVIEYKRDKNFSVIDQGYAYLALLLNNKADCILEYNEQNTEPLKRNQVDWSQTRIIFISQAFTNYQQEAINFKDLPIELWEIKRFENNTISYQQIQKKNATESIKTISTGDVTINEVTKEIKVYSEEEHLTKCDENIKGLYYKLKEKIMQLGDVEIKPKKTYIAFTKRTNIIDINIQRKTLKVWINMKSGTLIDSKGLCRDVSNTGHNGNGDYQLQISNDDEIEYITWLIKQAYDTQR